MWVAFANAKATHIFFSKNISVHMYAIFNVQNFNDTLTNNIVSSNNLALISTWKHSCWYLLEVLYRQNTFSWAPTTYLFMEIDNQNRFPDTPS